MTTAHICRHNSTPLCGGVLLRFCVGGVYDTQWHAVPLIVWNPMIKERDVLFFVHRMWASGPVHRFGGLPLALFANLSLFINLWVPGFITIFGWSVRATWPASKFRFFMVFLFIWCLCFRSSRKPEREALVYFRGLLLQFVSCKLQCFVECDRCDPCVSISPQPICMMH